ncbi:MAG: hypothetical protein IOC63_21525 [Methylobacterium sp.]|jgi:hypothetical protein|nr:hypothetical protein [Methylobacterium sp.]
MGEVVRWQTEAACVDNSLRARLEGLLAIFKAIDAAELLSALPECDIAQDQHKTALTLLALAERELTQICAEVAR